MSPVLDLLTKISVACGICVTCCFIQLNDTSIAKKPSFNREVRTLDTPWRYTSVGWQDSTHWAGRVKFPKPMAANIHPLVWTAMIMLAAIGLLVLGSNEVDSLVEAPQKTPRILARHRCTCSPRCKNFCLEELMPNQT